MKRLFLLSWLFCGSALAGIPQLNRPVMDEAGLFSNSEKANLENSILSLNARRGIQLAVFVPRSLEGDAIEGFSIRVVDAWKLGEKETDRGLLLLIAPNERKMRLEVGYGLEGELTDLFSRRVLDDILRPALRQNAPFQGVQGVLAAVDHQLSLSPEARALEEKALRQRAQRSAKAAPSLPRLLLFFILFLMFPILRPWLFGARGAAWGGHRGGFGGGGFSGGGGGFGGGGASSNW